MQRIRDYSTSQLERVHENYIFQRQKLRKFSAQNYLKMRETKNYTRKTMNKVMETIPALYLDLTACRQGLGQRQVSLEWERDEVDFLGVAATTTPGYPKKLYHSKSSGHVHKEPRNSLINDRRSESVYFTPAGTPMREVSGSPARNIPRDPYKAVYHHHCEGDIAANDLEESSPLRGDHAAAEESSTASLRPLPPFMKNGEKSKSFSLHFLPSCWFGTAVPNNNQTRSQREEHDRLNIAAVIENEASKNDYLDINPTIRDRELMEDEENITSSAPGPVDVGKTTDYTSRNAKTSSDDKSSSCCSESVTDSSATKDMCWDPSTSSITTRTTNIPNSNIDLTLIQRSVSEADMAAAGIKENQNNEM